MFTFQFPRTSDRVIVLTEKLVVLAGHQLLTLLAQFLFSPERKPHFQMVSVKINAKYKDNLKLIKISPV